MKQDTKSNAVEKALQIILAFSKERPTWGVRELATHLGFSPATVQRILQTLRLHTFVDQDPETRQYRLGNVYFSLYHTLQSTIPFSRTALPLMKQLVSKTRETAHLNIVDNDDRICIETVESPETLRASMPVGSRSPLYAGASSKCLLAFSSATFIDTYLSQVKLKPITSQTILNPATLKDALEDIRRQGYAISLGEHNPGLGAVSAPIFNHDGLLLAAISLAIPEIRYKENNHRNHCLEETIATAKVLSTVMGRQHAVQQSRYPEVI